MDASSLFAGANLHYVREEYGEALKLYSCAVSLKEDCAEYRVCRAAAQIKLGRFSEALQDAEAALKVCASSYKALHWKGVALFYFGDFSNARLAFQQSIALAQAQQADCALGALWLRKCDAELSGSTLPLSGLVTATSKVAATPEAEAAAAAPASTAAPSPPPAPVPAPVADAPQKDGMTISGRRAVRREWYQSSTHVVITVFLKGAKAEDVTAEFQPHEVSLAAKFPGSEDDQYSLDLDLFGEVEPSGCKKEVSKVKIEVTLQKKVIGQQWAALEKVDEPIDTSDQPAYPSSSKQKRDWNQVDRDCDSELKAEKPGGDEALNKLFQEIYGKADDETRRAMNKSFQTSGGTVLSTNWGEVGGADYAAKDRPTAPDGQEWRDWRNK